MGELKNTAGGENGELKIYFLPNLFTAGNLFCGFLALTIIVGAPSLYRIEPPYADMAMQFAAAKQSIYWALKLVLLACVFDLLDGRVARMGGYESPFGREFDSLADVVSFGLVPAFLVHRIVLSDVFREDMPELGWFIASVYVICGALRLARFNCLSAMEDEHKDRDDDSESHSSEFVGFPMILSHEKSTLAEGELFKSDLPTYLTGIPSETKICAVFKPSRCFLDSTAKSLKV